MNVGLNLQNNWTIQSGTSASRTQTEKVVFAKESTKEAEAQSTGETFSFSAPQQEVAYTPGPAAGAPKSGLASLGAEDRTEVRRIMKDLNKKARLFARNDKQQLVRIAPGTAKELLDNGKPIEVVTRVGNEVRQSGNSYASHATDAHFFIADNHYRSNSSSSSRTETVQYTSSPISDWDSVLWMDDADAKGVPGTPTLPASGGSVVVSSDFESRWAKSSEEYSGFFRVDTDQRNNSGYTKVSGHAEG